MPKQYEAIRDKAVAQGMDYDKAQAKAAAIYNSTHKDHPVTGHSKFASGGPVKETTMNKGYFGRGAHYAKGGAVLGKESQFLKTEDQFRATYHQDAEAGDDKPYGKSGPNAGKGEVKPPAAKGKSLSPVKPRA